MRSGCSGRKGFDSKGWKMKKLKQVFTEESKEKERLKRKGKKGNHIVFWKRKKK